LKVDRGDAALRQAIGQRLTQSSLRKVALAEAMTTDGRDGVAKCRAG